MRDLLEQLGSRINKAFDVRDESELVACIDGLQSLERKNELDPNDQAILHYYLGNAWSDLDLLRSKGSGSVWYYHRSEHINAIKCYRRSIATTGISHEIQNGVIPQALTNLGNMFSHAGRLIYAIEAWKNALRILPQFGMAGCNLCHGLIYYSRYLYDTNHAALILRYAHRDLNLHVKRPDIYPNARQAFLKDIEYISTILDADFLDDEDHFKEYSLGRSKAERDYRNWVLRNGLYLNPLNDVFTESAVAHDILMLPNMLVREYSAPVYQGFFNQLKQEYISARYFFYRYSYEIPEHRTHFADRDRHLVDTMDYPQYGVRYEYAKSAFRITFSLFDKIAYFLNEYFALGIERNKVYFRSLWYGQNRAVRSDLQQLNNLPLRGLYFLSKDFFDVDAAYLTETDPDAKNLAEIRNHIEHKYFKLHWFEPVRRDARDISYDELAYSMAEEDFAKMALRLLKSAREALIYLSSAVHAEEKKRENGGIVMPLHLFDYDR